MKKTVLFLCVFLFSMLLTAQKINVEDSFEQLAAHAEKKFNSLSSTEITRITEKDETKVQFNSKLELLPSVSNTISMTYKNRDTTFYFNSTLSTHKSISEANETLNAIVEKINKSGQGYAAKRYGPPTSDYPAYTVVRQAADKIRLYNVSISMLKDKSTGLYNLSYRMSGNNPVLEYLLIDVEPNNAQICKDIRSLVEDGKKDFAKYKGKKIENNNNNIFISLDTQYESKIKLEGSIQSYFTTNMIGTELVVELGTNLDGKDAEASMGRAFSVLGNSLGKGYAYKVNADNTRVDFVHINDFSYTGSFVNVAYIEAKQKPQGYTVALKMRQSKTLFN